MDGAEVSTWITGNKEVCETLQFWLDEARKGHICYLSLAAVKDRDQIAYDFCGAAGVERSAISGLQNAIADMELVRMARRLGPRNLNLDASYTEWHLSDTPMNWDFLIWLVDAEMTRRRYGAPGPLRVHFSQHELMDARKRDFFECVFRPLLPLIGAVEEVGCAGGRHKPLYVPSDIVLASKGGEEVPLLKAPEQEAYTMALWLHGTQPVTITLREASHWTSRNSNLDAWLKFAGDLKAKGEEVIFIRDTEKCIEPLPGYTTCPFASWSVPHRMALYERAKCNMFVSNGPAGLGLFSAVPYLYFVNLKPEDSDIMRYEANNPLWWKKSNGVCFGEQWPWALPAQRMIWKTDTYENISEAWEHGGIS